jgi:hypothetical protein
MIGIHPEHARAVLENLALGIVLVDRHERVSWANAHAASLLGLAAERLPGLHVSELPLPYCRPGAGDDPLELRTEGALIGVTQRFEHPGGPGAVVTLLERGHALVWCLSALASGVPATVAASGVLARPGLSQRLEAEISRSRRYANQLSCIGARLLSVPGVERMAELARELKGQLRWVDVLGQWQDDALVVLLPETDMRAARVLLEKLAQNRRTTVGIADVAFGLSTWQRGDTAEQFVWRALACDGRPALKRSRRH